jgi:hypothetical protein
MFESSKNNNLKKNSPPFIELLKEESESGFVIV